MEENLNKQESTTARPCPQDCGKCSAWQQMYCCAKMSFDLSKDMAAMKAEMSVMRKELKEVRDAAPEKVQVLSNPKTK